MNTKLEELKAKLAEIQKEIEKLEEEEAKYFNLSKNNDWELGKKWKICDLPNYSIAVRLNEEYAYKGFYLDDNYNWEIVTDSEDALVLLPTKK